MISNRDNPVWLLAVIAIGVLLTAYAVARPNGFGDSVTSKKASEVETSAEAAPANSGSPAPAGIVVPSPPAPVLDADDDGETLDLPVDGVNDGQPGQAPVEDITGRMTINDNGVPVPAGPPALSDHSISSEDEVPGAN